MKRAREVFSGTYEIEHTDLEIPVFHIHTNCIRCAPSVCVMGMIAEHAMRYIVKNMDGSHLEKDAVQVVVFNSIPYKRDVLFRLKMELPAESYKQGFVMREQGTGRTAEFTVLNKEKSSTFVDSIWDVPCIIDTVQ